MRLIKLLLALVLTVAPSLVRADSAYLDTNNRAFFVTKGTQKMTLGTGGAGTFEVLAEGTPVAKVGTGGVNFESGKTIAIQEATAGSACSGTVTFNGTTAVTKSTTCAATGARIFLTPTSDPTGSTAAYCWVTNIVNGVSFDVDCDQANDGTANWIIIKEAP